MDIDPEANRLAGIFLDCAVRVHRALGPGLREEYYRQCVLLELTKRRVRWETRVRYDLVYDGHLLPNCVEFDVVVEDRLLVELKAVELLAPHHFVQVRSYIRFGGFPLGILVNFHTGRLVDGWHRILPGQIPSDSAPVAASRRRMRSQPKGTGDNRASTDAESI